MTDIIKGKDIISEPGGCPVFHIGNCDSINHFRENAKSLPQAYSYSLNRRCRATIFYIQKLYVIGQSAERIDIVRNVAGGDYNA